MSKTDTDDLDGVFFLRGKRLTKDCSDEINAALSAWMQGRPHDTRLIPKLANVEGGAQGQTLVASDPIPVEGDAACQILKRLVLDVSKAADLGWIRHDLRPVAKADRRGGSNRRSEDEDDDDAGVAVSIIKKLQKAHRDCLYGRYENVRRTLRALLNQTNAQRGKHLTDEAYFLIRFNTEYLLERI